MREPDVTAVAVLVLLLGIGAGLNPEPLAVFSVTCDDPMLETVPFDAGLPPGSLDIGDFEFPDFGSLPEIDFDEVDPELGYGPI